MKQIFLALAAGVMGLSLAGTADAAPHRGGSHGRGHVVTRSYHHGHGVRFSGGHYYRGRNHHFWSRRAWDPVHRRYQYWNPHYRVYYYWYSPGNCYYPVTYCP
jgi:hypothetical protein